MKYFFLLALVCLSFKAEAQFFSTKLQQKLEGKAADAREK
jgi:hypothetical protein